MKFRIKILFHLLLFTLSKDHKKSRSFLAIKQARRLKSLGKHLVKSPFYRDIVRREFSLDSFPVMDKEKFMENFDLINTRNINKDEALNIALRAEETRDFSVKLNGVAVGLSTGTSGNRGIFLASENERAMWVAAILHRVLGLSLRKRKVAFFLRANSELYSSVGSYLLQFNFFDLMTSHQLNFEKLITLKADILVAQPSALKRIAESYQGRGLIPEYQKIISVAEVLDSSDRAYIEGVFRMKLDEVYQCTEGFLACSCKCGKLHLNDDFLIIEKEYLDDEMKRYHPIVTDLYRRTQPVIRYRLDDILVEGDKCDCGSSFDVIDSIEGRADQIIRLVNRSGKFVDIYPDYFRRAIVNSGDEIKDYTITQVSQDVLCAALDITPLGARKRIESSITKNISLMLEKQGVDKFHIDFVQYRNREQGTKIRRVINEYFKNI